MAKHYLQLGLLLLLMLGTTLPSRAASSVLVLDFSLKDDTLLPNVPDEIKRVSQLAPYLRSRLQDLGRDLKRYDLNEDEREKLATGYLMAHPELIQAIGQKAGVTWVVVGYSNKFSFLISWMRAFILETSTGKFVARGEADLRGAMTDSRMTRRSVVNLADQLHNMLTTIETRRAAREKSTK